MKFFTLQELMLITDGSSTEEIQYNVRSQNTKAIQDSINNRSPSHLLMLPFKAN